MQKSYIKQNPLKRKGKDKVCMHLAVDMWHWNNPRIHLSSNKQKKCEIYIFFFTEDKGNWFLVQNIFFLYGLGEEEVLFVYLGG